MFFHSQLILPYCLEQSYFVDGFDYLRRDFHFGNVLFYQRIFYYNLHTKQVVFFCFYFYVHLNLDENFHLIKAYNNGNFLKNIDLISQNVLLILDDQTGKLFYNRNYKYYISPFLIIKEKIVYLKSFFPWIFLIDFDFFIFVKMEKSPVFTPVLIIV